MTITLPSITVPPGCEQQAAQLLRGMTALFQFTANPNVVTDPAMRTVTTSLEHALNQGALQVEEATKAALPA